MNCRSARVTAARWAGVSSRRRAPRFFFGAGAGVTARRFLAGGAAAARFFFGTAAAAPRFFAVVFFATVFFAAVFFAVVFFAVVFFAAVFFFAVVFLAVVFLAAVFFFAVAFLAVVFFFAVAFLAVVFFFAVAFLAVVFFAAVFFAVVFFAAVFFFAVAFFDVFFVLAPVLRVGAVARFEARARLPRRRRRWTSTDRARGVRAFLVEVVVRRAATPPARHIGEGDGRQISTSIDIPYLLRVRAISDRPDDVQQRRRYPVPSDSRPMTGASRIHRRIRATSGLLRRICAAFPRSIFSLRAFVNVVRPLDERAEHVHTREPVIICESVEPLELLVREPEPDQVLLRFAAHHTSLACTSLSRIRPATDGRARNWWTRTIVFGSSSISRARLY